MTEGQLTFTRASLQNLATALSLWFICSFLYVAFCSLNYPFQLEWIEGQSMDIVQGVREGLPVYAEPSLEYVSLLYTPLFYFVSAFASLLTGMDFIAGRSVSTLAILATAALSYRWAKREGGSWQSGICAAGLLFATYRLSGRWFDIARVDSLSLFFTLASLYVLRFGHSTRAALAAGCLICAAFFTKQIAVVFLLPVALATIILRRRFGTLASLTAIAALLVCATLYEYASGGWFSFFIFKVPMGHRADHVKYFTFWENDVFLQQGFVLAAVLLGLWHWQRTDRKKAIFYGAVLVASLAATWSSRLHMYGWINNLMPLHATLALLAGLSLASLWQPRPLHACACAALILIQLASLLYDPWPLIPKPKSIEIGNNFLQEISKYKGDAFLPDIQFIAPRAAKKNFSYGMGAYDVFRSDLGKDSPVKTKLSSELETAIAQEKFGVIIPGRLIHYSLPRLNVHYRAEKELDYPEGYALDSLNKRRVTLFVPVHPKPENPSAP